MKSDAGWRDWPEQSESFDKNLTHAMQRLHG